MNCVQCSVRVRLLKAFVGGSLGLGSNNTRWFYGIVIVWRLRALAHSRRGMVSSAESKRGRVLQCTLHWWPPTDVRSATKNRGVCTEIHCECDYVLMIWLSLTDNWATVFIGCLSILGMLNVALLDKHTVLFVWLSRISLLFIKLAVRRHWNDCKVVWYAQLHLGL